MKITTVFLKNITLAAALLLAACAKIGSLQGGEKDTTPPALDSLRSTPNFQTRFVPKKFELTFNEWVQLFEVGTQVVVSPPLAKNPEVTLKGKTVRVQFDENEQLRPNSTYTVNFGNAVKDFTEGNPAKDLRFVFSTGEFLDSLRVSGSVVDAFTGEPVENIAVMLYDVFADSVVRRERPFYFSKTDKTGGFVISNVRADTFKIVAVENPLNYKWMGDSKIAFSQQPVVVTDSLRALPKLLLFKELPDFKRATEPVVNRYGLVRIGYSTTPPRDLQPRSDAPGIRLLTERSADSLLIWYDFPDGPPTENWMMFVGKDSAKVKPLSRDDFFKNKKLTFAGDAPPPTGRPSKSIGNRTQPTATPTPTTAGPKTPTVKTVSQNPSKPAALDFIYPLAALDTSKWLLLEDTAQTRVRAFAAAPDSVKLRSVQLVTAWKSGKNYALVLLPGAVTDFFGTPNADTLRRNFSVIPEKQLGGLNLTLSNLKPGSRYVFQLTDGTTVREERRFQATSIGQRLVFTQLETATYSALLIEDTNGNGRWDPGKYFEHRQPEAVFSKKLEPLRPNWELEATFEASGTVKRKI